MKKLLCLISVMCIIFMLGAVTASADNALFDFENESDYSNVTVDASAGKIELAKDPADANNNCVHIVDTGSGLCNAGFPFGKYITTNLEVSFRVKFAAKGVYSIVLLNNNPNEAMISFIGRDDGVLYTYNGSTQVKICNYELNKWYNVKIVADVTNNKFDITVNDINLKGYNFRNPNPSISTFRAGTVNASTGDFYVDDVSIPYVESKKIPMRTATAVEKNSLAKADDDKPNLNYLAFPTLKEVEENKIAVAYKRGFSHAGDYSDLEVTYINKTTSEVISRQTVESSTEACYQNPDLVTMPNGDTYCYTDIQKPNIGRVGVTVHKYNKDTDSWDFIADQLYDDKGIQYGYTFDGIQDGNRLYMLAMAFPILEDQGYGRSVHIIYTDDNGLSWKHFASLTDLIDVKINESGFIMYKDEILVISRGDDSSVHMYRVDKSGNLVKYSQLSAEYGNIWQAARPSLFTYNDKYYFCIRSFPDRNNQAYQEYTVFEYDPETFEVIEGTILDTRNGSAGDAYYGEHYVTVKDGKKYVHFIVHATKYTKKPSIDDYVFEFDEVFKPQYDIIVNDNIVNVSKEKNDGMIIFAYYKGEKFVKANSYLPENINDFEVKKSADYDRVKVMWWSDEFTALCAAESIETGSAEESSLMGKYISILGDSISSYGGYSDDTSVNTTLGQNVASSLYRGDNPILAVEETWWMQLIDKTGMKLLVNNTWGGAKVFGGSSPDVRYNTYKYRWDNLHSDTGELKGTNPDIIIVFIGCNDARSSFGTLGTFESINFDTLIQKNNGTFTYATPTNFAEAYAIMMHKIINKYTDAKVYCTNSLPKEAFDKPFTDAQIKQFNDIIFGVADKFGINKIDLTNNLKVPATYSTTEYTADGLHPNAKGMDLFTDVFYDALTK